ncbi:MAG: EF-hand domain-containing protein [Lysobacteraceae bacterium]|jgi:hypothetical protein|nr:calcium-binding protein [Xanthomonadaceae bacterium]
MTTTYRIATALVALGLASPLAFAQDAQGQAAPEPQAQAAPQEQGTSWAALDTDADGNISKQESQRHPGLASVFDEADGDGDGQLTPEEYRAFVQKQQGGAAQE